MTAPITTSKLDQAISRLNETRAHYGWQALEGKDAIDAVEEIACRDIAELWVKAGHNLDDWISRRDEMVILFDGEISYRTHRIELCDVVDSWEEDFGLGGDDFMRLQKQIEKEICYYMKDWKGACARI